MTEIPASPNFFSALDTTLSRKQVADLYGAIGWRVRKCSWVDYEVTSDWEELVIEAESPILMNGSIVDLLNRAEELIAPIRAAEIKFTAECYGPKPDRALILELRSHAKQ